MSDSGLEETRALDLPASRPVPAPELPPRVGRFVILRELGHGGMGVVYSAYDEQLDRRVAIKVVRRRVGESTERMRRESQAMAKLSHPNVATVYEVGSFAGQLYLAMEFIQGRTLAEWSRDRSRRLEEVLDVMRQAGRGLQAAHDAGLVHRDFKPENVMVGDDGRVRVLDFGLAGAHDERMMDDAGASAGASELRAPASSFETPLTEAGAVMGTPRYMSPEQFQSLPVGPKSDQFSFCVTLYELLYEERPFAGERMASLALSVSRGEVRAPPRGSHVPSGIRDVVLRGLSPDPEDRHEDIEALLASLDRASGRGKQVRLLGGLLAATLVGSLGVAYAAADDPEAATAARCRDAGSELDASWNADRRASVRAGLERGSEGQGSVAAQKVLPWLDEGAAAWRRARQRACVNHRVEGRWDDARAARATWCLEERRLELDALVTRLSDADAGMVRGAVASAAGLARVDRCVDERALSVMPEPPPESVRGRVASLRGDLWQARALRDGGRYGDGLALARATRAEVEALGWSGLVPLALLVEGELLEASGEYVEAEKVSTSAYFEAAHEGDWATAARAATDLVFVVGTRAGRHEEGRQWAEHASMALSHAGEPYDLLESERLHALGSVLLKSGAYDEAQDAFSAALAIDERVLGVEHPEVAAILCDLGSTQESLARYDEARVHYGRALQIRQTQFGDEHPLVAESLSYLGVLADATGDREQARELHQRALAIQERTLGLEHPELADTHNSLGVLAARDEQWASARAHFQRAYDLKAAELGPDHRDLATQLVNLGNVHLRLGEYEESMQAYERALEINQRTRGPRHAKVAVSLFNIGHLHEMMERPEEARRHYADALEVFEEAYGRDHPRVAFTLTYLGRMEAALGEHEAGIAHIERALELRSGKDTPREELAQSQFALARVLWAAPASEGRDRARALTLGEQARTIYAELGESERSNLDEVTTWLEARGA